MRFILPELTLSMEAFHRKIFLKKKNAKTSEAKTHCLHVGKRETVKCSPTTRTSHEGLSNLSGQNRRGFHYYFLYSDGGGSLSHHKRRLAQRLFIEMAPFTKIT